MFGRKRIIKKQIEETNKKESIFLLSPLLDVSGYANMGRNLFETIKKTNPIKVLPMKWANSSFLDSNIWNKYQQYFVLPTDKKFDATIVLTLPIEYYSYVKQKTINCGKKIGYTTFEAFPWLGEWVAGCNVMDELMVMSEFDKLNALGGGVSVPVNIKVPDIRFLKKIEDKLDLPTSFNFICIGQITPGDRKNIKKLIRCFLRAFENKNVGLILKVFVSDNSMIDFMNTEEIINECCRGKGKYPKVYLFHGVYTDDELSMLYSSSDVFITLTHGEGLGLSILEAVDKEIPVIAPYFSGYTTYLKKEFGCFLDYTIVPVSLNLNGVYSSNRQVWSDVDDKEVIERMGEIYKNYEKYKKLATSQKKYMTKKLIYYKWRGI